MSRGKWLSEPIYTYCTSCLLYAGSQNTASEVSAAETVSLAIRPSNNRSHLRVKGLKYFDKYDDDLIRPKGNRVGLQISLLSPADFGAISKPSAHPG